MYQLFVEKDLDLVEINPLGVSSTGEMMALDGKITANDNALGRHSELATLVSTSSDSEIDKQLPKNPLTELNWTDGEGNIGILCNGTCLAAATLDLIYQAKGKPATCLIVNGYASWDLQSTSSPVQQLQSALQQLTSNDGIKVVLVNILSSPAASKEVAEVIAKYLLSHLGETSVLNEADRAEKAIAMTSRFRQERSDSSRLSIRRTASQSQLPQFVIRVVGGNFDTVKEDLVNIPVHWIDTLDEAVAKAISLATAAIKKP
jgi:succinyl-CoA synthetase beta subunit